MSEHQIIEQSQSRKHEDLHQREALVNYYHHFPLGNQHLENQHLENQHLEANINQNMIILNRNTGPKENEVGREIIKDHPIKKDNPKHDTEKDDNRTRTHWRKAKRLYLVGQLAKHGWRWPKTRDGRNAKLAQKELAQIMIDLLGL